MSHFIRAALALCQTVFVAQLWLGLRTDHGTNMLGSIWNNKVSFDWLDVHKNGTSSCLSCSMGFYNQLLIKVVFWNWNSKTVSATLKYLSFLFAWIHFHGFIYNALMCFWSVAIKINIFYNKQWECNILEKGYVIQYDHGPLQVKLICRGHPIKLLDWNVVLFTNAVNLCVYIWHTHLHI